MECLRDYIGVRGCGAGTPLSGKYMNDLPGISLERFESITSDEQKTYLEIWDKIQTRALAKFKVDVNEKFAKHFRVKQVRSNVDLLKRIDKTIITAAAPKFRGFSSELTRDKSVFVASNFQSQYVESLSLYIIDSTSVTAPIVLNIIDLDTQEVIDTKNITTPVNGWNTVVFSKLYDYNRIGCVYNATTVQSPLQKIDTIVANGYYAMIDAIYGTYADPFLRGLECDTDFSNPIFGINTFGFTGIIGVHCKFDRVVCNNREAFSYPLWYCLGFETMAESMNSSRVNPFTSGIDREKAGDLMKDFYSEYDKSLMQVCDSISLPGDDFCLECNERLQFRDSQM